jgi:hypothetical protein
MTNAALAYASECGIQNYKSPIRYIPSLNSVITTEGATISVINFSDAEPVEPWTNRSPRTVQSPISSAMAKMRISLLEGIRPSIEVKSDLINDSSDEDIFWVKVSQFDPLD